MEARKVRIAEAGRQLEALRAFSDLSVIRFLTLKTFKTILDRDRGCTTPVEEFLVHLVWLYEKEDEDGLGLTIEAIESAVEDLKSADLEGEIEQAHSMARRYPLPKPEKVGEESASNQ